MSSVVAPQSTAPEAPECPVCYEPCGTNPKLRCGHGLCSGCESVIRAAPPSQGGRKCPLCRADFPPPPAPAPPPVPDAFTRRGQLAEELFRLRDEMTAARAARDRYDATINTLGAQISLRLSEFAGLMAGQGFGGTTVHIAGHSVVVPPAAAMTYDEWRATFPALLPAHLPPVTEAIARANDARAARQMGAAPAPVPHNCGHRGCPARGGSVRLRDVRGFTRRVWRCDEHRFG